MAKIGGSGGISTAEADSLFYSNLRAENGWARYFDTQYTEATPFTVADAATVALPNNAGQTSRNTP